MAGAAILIAAQSGRALAEAARRAGLRPFVADLFADSDTLELAAAHRPLEGRFGTGRLAETVLAHLDALSAMAGGAPLGVVLGSGFEAAPALIAAIGRRHRLVGAGAETVSALKDPLRFAALCATLAIPHPAVTRARLDDPKAWLLKRAGGSGGSHIRTATSGPAPAGAYFQARVPGRAFALNILADASGARILALTEQWSAPSLLRPFRYAGALAPGRREASALPDAIVAAVTEAADELVRATGLRGLASVDFLSDGEAWWLTEINPRPGATLDVLDRRGVPLLRAHVEACLGHAPEIGPAPEDAAASQICYAARDHAVVPAVAWPDHVRDRPRAGTRVMRDAPLCTVLAGGPDGPAARQELGTRIASLRDRLSEEETHEHQPAEPERHRDAPGGALRR
ncbi:ATP-grasp domain-containing protein [Methylobacterium sp. E-041]|uniref:ATP-grasp domain-containing protein n=1 Tax=Methylobacterium sp. E-041 TaxID=2836573 RepID=UPI001FBBC45E|nr:ATP-grasp domain-containing protein [Methylobacterium sp. E-041]MCJ2104326.1 ATP-grasp domain-containing protein [Methylobacterium sp. E-041]